MEDLGVGVSSFWLGGVGGMIGVVEGWSAGVSSFGIDGVTTVIGFDSTMGAGGLIGLGGGAMTGLASATGGVGGDG
jgi:hypothetical protein